MGIRTGNRGSALVKSELLTLTPLLTSSVASNSRSDKCHFRLFVVGAGGFNLTALGQPILFFCYFIYCSQPI